MAITPAFVLGDHFNTTWALDSVSKPLGRSAAPSEVTLSSYEGYIDTYDGGTAAGDSGTANAANTSSECWVEGFYGTSMGVADHGASIIHHHTEPVAAGTDLTEVQADLKTHQVGNHNGALLQYWWGSVGIFACGVAGATCQRSAANLYQENTQTGYRLALTNSRDLEPGVNWITAGGSIYDLAWTISTVTTDGNGNPLSSRPSDIICSTFTDETAGAVPTTADVFHRVKIEVAHGASSDVITAYMWHTSSWRPIGTMTVATTSNHYWARGANATAGIFTEFEGQWNGVTTLDSGWYGWDSFSLTLDGTEHAAEIQTPDEALPADWNTEFDDLATALDNADISDRDVTRGPFTLHVDCGNLADAASRDLFFRSPCNAAIRGMAVSGNSSSVGNITVNLNATDLGDILDQGDGLTVTKAHGGGGWEYTTEGWDVSEWRYLRRGVLYRLRSTNSTGNAAEITASVNLLPMRTKF